MKWPSTKSDSSATTNEMDMPNYPSESDRISYPPISSTKKKLSSDPIKVSHEVKYKQYENDKRVTTDFGTESNGSDTTAGFDGTKTIMPMEDDNKSDIVTNFSKS